MAETGKAGPEVILVADDIPANVELLLDQLNSLGYETITATDGPSAVAAAFEKQPDLCILDVSMPAGAVWEKLGESDAIASSENVTAETDAKDRASRPRQSQPHIVDRPEYLAAR